jgi:hypothetical protein
MHGAGAIAYAVEEREEATESCLVKRRKLHSAASPFRGCCEVASRLFGVSQIPGSGGCTLAQSRALDL